MIQVGIQIQIGTVLQCSAMYSIHMYVNVIEAGKSKLYVGRGVKRGCTSVEYWISGFTSIDRYLPIYVRTNTRLYSVFIKS